MYFSCQSLLTDELERGEFLTNGSAIPLQHLAESY